MTGPRVKPKQYRLRTLQDLFELPPGVIRRALHQLGDAVLAWQSSPAKEEDGPPVNVLFTDDGCPTVEVHRARFLSKETEG